MARAVSSGTARLAIAAAASFFAMVVVPRFARADAPSPSAETWCRHDLVTLQGDVCYAPGPSPEAGERRTLVIFLHGLTEDGSGWQLTMQEGMARAGQALRFSLLAPRGRNGLGPGRKANVVAWPTSEEGRREAEDEIWERIARARAEVEAREGAPFDEVFVVGFSNGAYYASSLALRGRLDGVDGYAVIAGGSAATKPAVAKAARKPVFVGVASRDDTAKKGRELARLLQRAGWPHRVSEKKVGHVVSDDHLAQGLAYLRAAARGEPARAAAPTPSKPPVNARKEAKPSKKKAGSRGRRAK